MIEMRRGFLQALFCMPVMGEGPGRNATACKCTGPRLVKPKAGPILEAWAKEKNPPGVVDREASVRIDWNAGVLSVRLLYTLEKHEGFDAYDGDQWFVMTSELCDESYPGSFTVPDDVARRMVERHQKNLWEITCQNAARAVTRTERKRLLAEGRMSINEARAMESKA